MKFSNLIKFLFIPIFTLATISTSFAAEKEEKQAIQSAIDFLHLVDNGAYAESWAATATIFKKAINQGQWSQTVETVRNPLGHLVNRDLVSAKHTTSIPGAPDGEYVVIIFKTKFSNKENAIETITPMLESDGRWRVSGYYIK